MKLLLDTATFLWMYLGEKEHFSKKALHALEKSDVIYLSAVSSWEIAIKFSLGKLELKTPPQDWLLNTIQLMGIESLPVYHQHSLHVAELPWHHKDPFDRLLISQSIQENLTLLSPDSVFKKYPVELVW